MIAKHLTTTAVKGHSFNADLSPLVSVIGPNYSGKTAFLDSIRLALMGELPGAKRAADIFALSSGPRMAVALDFSDGDAIKRSWWKEGTSIRSDAQDRPEFTTPLLNAGEYFSLTPGKRLQYIAARVALKSDAGAKEIMAELREKLKEAEIPTEDNGLITAMLASIQVRLMKEGVQEALNAMLEKTTKPTGYNLLAEHSNWNAIQKDRIGAVRTLSELKNREQECSAETIESIRTEIKALQESLAKLNERYGALKQVKESNEKGAKDRQIIEEWLAKPKELFAKQAKLLKEGLKEQEAKMAKVDLSGDNSATIYQQAVDARWKATQAADKITELKAKIEQHQKDLAQIAEKEQCPYCKSKSKGWKDRIKKELEDEVAMFEKAIATHKKEMDAAQDEVDRLEKLRAKRLQDEMQATEIQTAIDLINLDIVRAKQNDEAEKNKVAQYETVLKSFNATPFDEEEFMDIADAITVQKQEIETATARLDTANKLQQDIRRATEAQEEYQTAATTLAAVKLAGAFLREKQQASTNALISSLLEPVNFFTDGILRAPLALHEDEIGYFLPNGRFVTHETFSGFEKMLTYIALGAALSSKGKLRIALPDEMGVLSPGMRTLVMNRFVAAVSQGILDQVVLAIPADSPKDVKLPGWQTITLEP